MDRRHYGRNELVLIETSSDPNVAKRSAGERVGTNVQSTVFKVETDGVEDGPAKPFLNLGGKGSLHPLWVRIAPLPLDRLLNQVREDLSR